MEGGGQRKLSTRARDAAGAVQIEAMEVRELESNALPAELMDKLEDIKSERDAIELVESVTRQSA